MEAVLPALAKLEEEAQSLSLRQLWSGVPSEELLVMLKLLSGTFRVGVGEGLVLRALASISGLDVAELQHRLMGGFEPSAAAYGALLRPGDETQQPIARPYPFFLASTLDPERLADSAASDWLVEWKWDGIRAQLIHREGCVFLWSRGEELINGSFPELVALGGRLPQGTVLDGEVLIWRPEKAIPEPFAALQRRLGRREPSRALLRELPAAFVAYDLLESGGLDRRPEPLRERRQCLEALLQETQAPQPSGLRPSAVLPVRSWLDLEPWRLQAREHGAEGLMVKQLASSYGSGRRRGSWWKHKLAPMCLDAVLLYARNGSGRRANLYTDYTFGLWAEELSVAAAPDAASSPRRNTGPAGLAALAAAGPLDETSQADPSRLSSSQGRRLVSFASAYSGLTDNEIQELDRWIRRHTTERFGPVRAVEPRLVFELAFEGVQRSSRHRSGLAVRFPRINRWRHDKSAEEADTLASALALITP
jgi:DNA ligase-1